MSELIDRRRPWEAEYIDRMVTRLAFEAFDLDFIPQAALEKAEQILAELIAERDQRVRRE